MGGEQRTDVHQPTVDSQKKHQQQVQPNASYLRKGLNE